MTENGPILTFEKATLATGAEWDCGVDRADFTLAAGEYLRLRLEPGRTRVPLADAACGAIEPAEGAVLFEGTDWRSMRPDRAAACRGRIGRVFESRGWLSNLDVDENVTLARRYHTSRPVAEIREEAERLARAFGLQRLPAARRPAVPVRDLRRAAWVRAFLGDPDLIILERPGRDLHPGALEPLAEAIGAALARGAAVICTAVTAGGLPDVETDRRRELALRGTELVAPGVAP